MEMKMEGNHFSSEGFLTEQSGVRSDVFRDIYASFIFSLFPAAPALSFPSKDRSLEMTQNRPLPQLRRGQS